MCLRNASRSLKFEGRPVFFRLLSWSFCLPARIFGTPFPVVPSDLGRGTRLENSSPSSEWCDELSELSPSRSGVTVARRSGSSPKFPEATDQESRDRHRHESPSLFSSRPMITSGPEPRHPDSLFACPGSSSDSESVTTMFFRSSAAWNNSSASAAS